MKHPSIRTAALASLLIVSSTHAFELADSPSTQDGVAGVEWVRQTLESGFNRADVRPTAWAGPGDLTEQLSSQVTLTSLEASEPGVPASSAARHAANHGPQMPNLPPTSTAARAASLEEVVVRGVRQRAQQWHPPIVEAPENDWRDRDEALHTDARRVEAGRAVVYEDLSDRRRYDRFSDEYLAPRPQRSVAVGLGKRRAQD